MDNPIEVITPYDDPYFHPDWRIRLATRLAAEPGKRPLTAIKDEWIRHAVKCMKAKDGGHSGTGKGQTLFRRLARWASGGTNERVGHVIEALLLTDAPMSAIAEDIGCSVDDVWAYELLYFNVRDSQGSMKLSPAQRTFFATEGVFKAATARPEHLMWRRVAVSAGYRALLGVLELGEGRWSDAPKVDLVDVTMNMGRSEALAKLAAGAMSTGEFSRLDSNRIKDRLVRHTTGDLGKKDEGMELALQLMQLLGPKMVPVEHIQEAQAQRAAENIMQAEATIAKTEIEDNGPIVARDALTLLLKKKGEEIKRSIKGGSAKVAA